MFCNISTEKFTWDSLSFTKNIAHDQGVSVVFYDSRPWPAPSPVQIKEKETWAGNEKPALG